MKKPFSISFIICILLMSITVEATTHTMTACTQAAFTTAYNAAVSGDTIAFPAGACSVTMTKAIAKTNLTIVGQGTSNGTTITGGFTCTGTQCNGLRITAIRFVGGPAFESGGTTPSSPLSGVRVDHCYFYNGAYFFTWYDVTNSVVDHCTFDTITGEGNYAWGGVARSAPGFPYSLGSASGGAGIYYEDNTVINPNSMAHFIAQSRGGSRVVMRYNVFNLYQWDPFDAHDNYESTSESGSATYEYYNNVLNYTGDNKRIFHMRGGQGVIYNNYVSGSQTGGIDWNSYILCQNTCTKGSVGICSWQNQGDYAWSNKQGCTDLATCDPHNMAACCSSGSAWPGAASCSGGGTNQQLVLNTDYFNTAMPSYTAYTYPHPLVSGGSDTTAPSVTAFTIPSTYNSLVVPINSFSATDAVGVTGYLISESSTTPLSSDSRWVSVTSSTSWTGFGLTYTFASQGAKTLYAWTKDAAGNVSSMASASVTIALGQSSYTMLGGCIVGGIAGLNTNHFSGARFKACRSQN